MIKLYEHRAEKGYSLAELSKRSGVSISHIHNIENGIKTPTITTVCVIARALKMPCCRLLECYSEGSVSTVSQVAGATPL